VSRNLCSCECQHCGARPELVEVPRPITEADAGPYLPLLVGTLVAHAECPLCCAKYIAWVDDRGAPRSTYMGASASPGIAATSFTT